MNVRSEQRFFALCGRWTGVEARLHSCDDPLRATRAQNRRPKPTFPTVGIGMRLQADGDEFAALYPGNLAL